MLNYFFPLKHAGLLAQFCHREIHQKFKGSWFGLSWALITPIAMLAVYTFVFRTVLQAKWPGAEDSTSEFAIQIFSGLLVFTLFSEVIGRAPRLILEQPNLVKKVIFPLEILPWVSSLTALFYASISTLVLIVAAIILRGDITIHLLATPLVFAAFVPILLGLSWLLAALGVFLRDADHIVGLILTPMLFLSPVFYPVSMLPDLAQPLMLLNPLTQIIESLRTIVLDQTWPDFTALIIYSLIGLLISIMGAWFFEKTRKGFADVL